jgi:hypothetical protein
MLRALERLDTSRTANVLSIVARKILPQPDDSHDPNQADQEAANDVIKELSAKVASSRKTKGDDTLAIQEELSREISSYLLRGGDVTEIRARVGNKGALSPSIYRISFSPRFDQIKEFWGISKTHVISAISKCDQFQHFISRIEKPDAPAHSSLFVKTIQSTGDPYTIIVKCQRAGDMLIIDEAYRVYHDEVNLLGAATPLDVLKRFVQVVGREVEIMILNSDETLAQPPDKGKFFHDVVYNVARGGVIVQKFMRDTVRFSPTEDGPVGVDLSFEVDSQKYASQLLRHGIKVNPATWGSSYIMRNVKNRR